MNDYILNGQGYGGVASALMANGMDPRALRPYVERDGRAYIAVNANGKIEAQLVGNAAATLLKDEWIRVDDAVMRVAKPRMRAWSDLQAAGLTYDIPNGMGWTVLQHQTMGDISPATISMDAIRQSERDRPTFDIGYLPLPIVHKDFSFTLREVMVSRNGGAPLDTTTAELATRRVTEEVEKLTLGVSSSYSYGGGTIYGYTNFPSRITKVLTNPTGVWSPSDTVAEILSMKALAQAAYHYGPYMVYTSPNWDAYMDDDYSSAKGDNTLRERIARIDGIRGVRTLDYLTGYQILLVQMTTDVVRAVTGMGLTTVQWESHGGMQLNFKVMCIMVPQLRADNAGNTGIVHGTAP